jgi:hypothetical protein
MQTTGSRTMGKIDYMKLIGVLSKSLKMEILDVKYTDKSIDKLEVTLGGQSMPGKIFRLSISNFSADIVFQKEYLDDPAFDKWKSAFEYELEQAYAMNISIQVDRDTSNHVVKVNF